jgi:hypothetical protein
MKSGGGPTTLPSAFHHGGPSISSYPQPNFPSSTPSPFRGGQHRDSNEAMKKYLQLCNIIQKSDDDEAFIAALSPATNSQARYYAGYDFSSWPGKKPILLEAASYGATKICTRLLEDYKFDVNVIGKDSLTALHYASFYGHPATVKVLLQHGANVTVKNKWGEDPVQSALNGSKDPKGHSSNGGHEECILLLQEALMSIGEFPSKSKNQVANITHQSLLLLGHSPAPSHTPSPAPSLSPSPSLSPPFRSRTQSPVENSPWSVSSLKPSPCEPFEAFVNNSFTTTDFHDTAPDTLYLPEDGQEEEEDNFVDMVSTGQYQYPFYPAAPVPQRRLPVFSHFGEMGSL